MPPMVYMRPNSGYTAPVNKVYCVIYGKNAEYTQVKNRTKIQANKQQLSLNYKYYNLVQAF